ncbi:type VI secretion system tip protein VgrG, partial [Neisseria sp. P0022.S007]|uniref:type VI secretion system tip protein VgrG n=1 Tax=unclassified Neisseria TaxID=2623750 RepID=UPI003F7E0F1B
SIRHNPIVEGIRTADYNYRSADTDLFAETDNKQSEESADNTVLLGKQQHWGLHPKTPDEAQVQTTLLNEAVLCRQTVTNGSGNVVSMTPMKVFQTDVSFPEAPDGWLVLSMEHSGSRDTAYSHTFTAIPAQLAYRPKRTTPRPHIAGTLPARVTAAENCTYAYIDDMGRYRVKLPFDLDEWSPGGESRPVRLAKPYAGPEYGIHFPLHEGTEVMLSFVQGNPDRPYISGVMHDSTHTDHIPADWNTRNVIRTWANNKLRMEDLKGQEHIKLATDYQKSQLNLGHIVDSNREKRGKNGEGFELRTDGWGAVRAGKGILVSAQNQDANGKVLDMDDAISQLEQALSLAKSLNKAAQTANNHNTDEETQRGRLKDALKELKEAGLIQTAPAGIATATQQSQLHTANENIHLVSGANTDITAGQSLTAHAAESLNLFAQSSGIKMQANQGKVEVQAQNDELQLNALKDATLTSSAGKITIAAKEEVLITCKGAYIKLANGEMEIGSPKVVRVRAPLVVNGPNSLGITHPDWPKTLPKRPMRINLCQSPHSDHFFIGMPYTIYADGEEIQRGVTDATGYIAVEHEIPTSKYKIVFANDLEYLIPIEDEFNENTSRDKITNRGFHGLKYTSSELSPIEQAKKYFEIVHNIKDKSSKGSKNG